ncbi:MULTISPECIES: class I SAM-dependent methyltransferase [unclassified Streptomyces]|uniref:class I SAM-dependent methyltransferase n=1 Tax=unclassified Streptomyces TaxID=2593676 RepID=UPI0022B5F6E3|nr:MULTISPECIES: class I SAM-dependent methyltransferase [unclassified Streptomyces]MCZ7416835.1 class I SAM-dependent methyltransferase [Streptomyces sp. WMMC897]MCZ7433342.1 class I SAM-dependent methyltransferase [Streptomyces sp. WMMC1477]
MNALHPVPGIDSCERVEDVVAKVIQECQNGLPSRVLHLSTAVPWEALTDRLAHYARYIDGAWARRDTGVDLRVPRAAVTVELLAGSVLVCGHRTDSSGAPDGTGLLPRPPRADEVWRQADTLMDMLGGERPVMAPAELEGLLKHDSWLVATLASDLLNRLGTATVPHFVRDHDPQIVADFGGARPADGRFTESWESRISVDEYALYEATHPAYAVQMVELGRTVRAHAPAVPETILDVGSGPGLPTVMLAEMFPDARIEAVEPSAAAFPHLVRNTARHRITAHHTGICEYAGPTDHPLTVSVGASHHLDTRVFLKGMKRHTAPGGLIVVADEMISPFSSEEQRSRIIADHHLAYIEEALAHVRAAELPPEEQRRLEALRGVDRRTPGALHRLLEQVRRERHCHHDDDSPWQRVRFTVLELEALVAGLDYDVERKTYPENFMALAEDEGLEILDHTRVHATLGPSDREAGTHVFTLRTPRSR